jgi:hypothetical protein
MSQCSEIIINHWPKPSGGFSETRHRCPYEAIYENKCGRHHPNRKLAKLKARQKTLEIELIEVMDAIREIKS